MENGQKCNKILEQDPRSGLLLTCPFQAKYRITVRGPVAETVFYACEPHYQKELPRFIKRYGNGAVSSEKILLDSGEEI